MDQNPSSSRVDRKTIEKNRRNEMKALYSQLHSLVPHQFRPRGMASPPDQLEAAANYIKMQEAKVEKLKQKKNLFMGMSASASASASWSKGGNNLPNVDVRVTGCSVQVVLITGPNSQFMFNGIIRLLHEEGAEVIGATFSVLENTVFHTIHSKIGDQTGQAGRISDRLRKFVYDCI